MTALMSRSSMLFALGLTMLASASVVHAQGFDNPVVPGFHPDPSVCRVGRDYYLVNSSFAYAPGIPVFHSRDLVSWRQVAYAVTGSENLPLDKADLSAGLWAPTIRYHKGRFYMVTTNKTKGGNFFVWAKKPEGPWSKPVWFDPDGWDPSLFFDDDGKAYLTRNGETPEGGFGILQYQIDLETGRRLSEPKIIWKGSGGFGVEGPHMYKVGGRYMLIAAEGGTHAGHMITAARSDSVWGPFESYAANPILSQRNHLLERIQATGHGDLVQTHDGAWWIVFLGIRNFASPMHMMHTLGRETFLAPVTWRDGWPIPNDGAPIKEHMAKAPLPLRPWGRPAVRTRFHGKRLGLEWNTLRNLAPDAVSLSRKPGAVSLCAQPDDLSTARGTPAFLGRRQEHHYVRVAAEIDVDDNGDTAEAGLTVYMNERFHYDLVIRRHQGKRQVLLRRTIEDLVAEPTQVEVPEGPLVLQIEGNPWTYFFSVQTPQGSLSLGKARSRLLSTEVAGGFTGMYFGFFAQGGTGESRPCASATWFDYEPLPPK